MLSVSLNKTFPSFLPSKNILVDFLSQQCVQKQETLLSNCESNLFDFKNMFRCFTPMHFAVCVTCETEIRYCQWTINQSANEYKVHDTISPILWSCNFASFGGGVWGWGGGGTTGHVLHVFVFCVHWFILDICSTLIKTQNMFLFFKQFLVFRVL